MGVTAVTDTLTYPLVFCLDPEAFPARQPEPEHETLRSQFSAGGVADSTQEELAENAPPGSSGRALENQQDH
jgi:hypothetical protein